VTAWPGNPPRQGGNSLWAYAAPIDVILSSTTIVQPDVCYLGEAKLPQVLGHGIVGPPDILVEILSPRTTRLDQVTKRHLYAKHGVAEYWIIDQERDTLQIATWSETGYRVEADRVLAGDNRLTSPCAPGLDVPARELFWSSATRRR
jgi:Uma2 family endonuclease